jgi:hypothetical protein
MKAHLQLISLVTAALFAFPAMVFAAPSSTSPYYTDKVNSYVQDQVSRDMEELNGFLCMVSAMAPDQMVNLSTYIALVDMNACKPHIQNNNNNAGNNNQSAGADYLSVEVNSARVSNTTPMLTKIWADKLKDTSDPNNILKYDVRMYASASQAPSNNAPYGVFRMDYCKQYATDADCTNHIGYIDATKSGLSFFTKDFHVDPTNGRYYNEFALQLSSSSSTSNGSGIVIKTSTNNSSGTPTTTAVVFANNADYFYRNDGVNPAQCFDRAESKAQIAAWRYGLYNADGTRLKRESGFPLTYVYTSANTSNTGTVGETYNGYINYSGLSMPVTLEANAAVTRTDYNTVPPTTTNYTLKQTGGVLTKYSTYFGKLSELSKLPFDFYPNNNVLDSGNSTAVLIAGTNYQVYWDKDANAGAGGFFRYSTQVYDPVNFVYNYVKDITPLALSTTSMAASLNSNNLWTQSDAYGYFSINGLDFANIAATGSNTRIITNSYNTVYPADFAAINTAGGLRCITDCMTKNKIDAYNTAYAAGNYYVSYYERPTYTYNYSSNATSSTSVSTAYTYSLNNTNSTTNTITDTYTTTTYIYTFGPPASSSTSTSSGSGSDGTLANLAYTMNTTTGNLVDYQGKDVIQTINWGVSNGGRMISKADMDYILAQKCAGYPNGACTTVLKDADIDILANKTGTTGYSYYYWSTGPDQYSRLAYLVDTSNNPLKLYPPLTVNYTVPNDSTYGSYRNSSLRMWYADFGTMWGIPYKCIDYRSNTDCIYTNANSQIPTPYQYMTWVPSFSIPFDTTSGVVVSGFNGNDTADPAYVAPGTQFLVKPLDKELRLQNVNPNICSVQNLGTNITVTKLPSDTLWVDPSSIGAKPVLNPVPAPRVINGIVQY